MNETPRRRWWRLHGVTWGSIIVTTAVTVFHHWIWSPYAPGGIGWPLHFYDEGRTDSIHLRESPRFYPHALAIDVFIFAAIVWGYGWASEKLVRARIIRARFSISNLLVATASVGSCIVVFHWDALGELFNAALAAKMAVIAGICLGWAALFDVFGIAWNRLTSRRQPRDAPDPESAPSVSKPL